MEVLVTGGAGFIGSHLCENLLNKGFSVICVDDFNDYYNPKIKEENIKPFLKNTNFVLKKLDIRQKDKLEEIFKNNKIKKIAHLAARAGVRASMKNPELYFDVNVNGTKNLLDLAVKYKIENFVFGSSSSVYGANKKVPFSENDNVDKQICPYAESKRKAELLCNDYNKNYGLKVTCLRFFTVYGPRGRPDMAPYKFVNSILNEKEITMFGDGTSKRDYTYVADIVDGIISALDKNLDFEIINLGDSNPIDLKRFIRIIEQETGKKAKIIQAEMQEGDISVTYADISKAKKLLNYKPKVKIEQGIRNLVNWFKTQAF